jgi:carbonic anhydrase
MERRDLFRLAAAGAAGILHSAGNAFWMPEPARSAELPPTATPPLDPELALQTLMDGNQRFIHRRLRHPHQTQARLQEVAQAQHPFATILSCADSRVPAEIVFDLGIGDIFDVRIAGNIATPEAVGSIEYAVELLGTPVLMVLGHERCGAVTAAVKREALPGEMSTFVKAILPAVNQAKGKIGDEIDNVVIANVHYQMDRLKRSPVITQRLQDGRLKLVGGRYDLDTGAVKILT